MATFLIITTTLISLYGLQSHWFDTRPHYLNKTYQSEKACDLATTRLPRETGRVCVPKNDHSGQFDLYTTKDE